MNTPTIKPIHKIAAAISFIVMVTVNALANILPINQISTGAVSDSYPNLFAPAGITFAIWGIIYILLGIFSFSLFQIPQITSNSKYIRIANLFTLTSIINSLWIFAWHYNHILISMILMLMLLITLISLRLSLQELHLTKTPKYVYQLPISVYFGWITVATIANMTTLLVSLNFTGFGFSEVLWTVTIIGVGAIIGIITARRLKDNAYLLVFIWAYAGIYIKHTSPLNFNSAYPTVIYSVVICLALFVIALFFNLKTIYGPKKQY